MNKLDRKANEARHLIENGRADLARPLLAELVAADDWRSNYLLGHMYWRGGYKVPADEALAIANFRLSMERHPAALTALHLARALVYQGSRDEALEWIHYAAANGNPPETDLAFAKFWESADPPDLRNARMHYRRAYRRGRIAGLFHLARLRRDRGQVWRAIFIALGFLPLTLLYHLVLGRRARASI
jgi:TPR repeat protein